MGAGAGSGEDLDRADTGTSTIGSARRPEGSVAGMTSVPSFCGTGGSAESVLLASVVLPLCHQIPAAAATARTTNARSMIPPACPTGDAALF
jgi:hypothetical protein